MTSPFASLGSELNTYTLEVTNPSNVTYVTDSLGTLIPTTTTVNYSVYVKFIKDRKGLPKLNSNQQLVKLYFFESPSTIFNPYLNKLNLVLTDANNVVLSSSKFELQSIFVSQFKVVNTILNYVWEGVILDA
jgi:hypothetical protein